MHQTLKAEVGERPVSRQRLHAIRFPERYRARANVLRSVKVGELPEASTLYCVRCGKSADQYHHYLGYAKEHQLTVWPMCEKCHLSTPTFKAYRNRWFIQSERLAARAELVVMLNQFQQEAHMNDVDFAARIGLNGNLWTGLSCGLKSLTAQTAEKIANHMPEFADMAHEYIRSLPFEMPKHLHGTPLGKILLLQHDLGLTTDEFARSLGISGQYWRHMKTGRYPLTQKVKRRVLVHYGAEILADIEEAQP